MMESDQKPVPASILKQPNRNRAASVGKRPRAPMIKQTVSKSNIVCSKILWLIKYRFSQFVVLIDP